MPSPERPRRLVIKIIILILSLFVALGMLQVTLYVWDVIEDALTVK